MSAAFKGNQALVLINCRRDLFEPLSLFKPTHNTDAIRCVLLQFHLMDEIFAALAQR
jgi:hypothetical protein